MEAGRAHSESKETKNRVAGDTSSFHDGKKESRAPQTKETTSKFNLLNMRRLCPCRMSERFRQGAELPATKHLRHMCCYGHQKGPCLGEGAKMVPGTEGRGPWFLDVRMHEKTT